MCGLEVFRHCNGEVEFSIFVEQTNFGMCVCIATTLMLMNGSSTHEFELRRGLRQVDPLSPFLFLITNKGQNGILNAIVDACLFFGYTLGQTEAMHDSHLLFADYGRENWVNMTALKSNLILFEVISGLKVNFHKSLLVRVNVFKSWMVDASLGLNCKIGYIPFLYPIFS